MLSLASLLNPAPPGPPINRFPPSPASSSSPTTSLPDESGLPEPMMPKHKVPKSVALIPATRPKGVVNFYPHERLDEASLRQVRRFRVQPLGNIQEHARHIPYNSGKKDFFDKTGRESFEVFQYDFKMPGDENDYTIMWDYNVGLVRMTPFFKCCKYPKTTPAKMLNLNPGLKEITHSITGGSIMAQGYWMPFQCAKAVCATFCHNIAGALIPIFGPDFPSLCTPAEAPEYSRMVINPDIVHQCTREAEHFRRIYNSNSGSGGGGGGGGGNQSVSASSSVRGRLSPMTRDGRLLLRNSYGESPRHLTSSSSQYHHHRHQHPARKPFVAPGYDSPYATDTDNELSPVVTERGSLSSRDRFYYSSIPPPPPPPPPPPHPAAAVAAASDPSRATTSGWTPANVAISQQHHHHQQHHQYNDAPGPSPWLSAVPRFTTTDHLPPYHPSPRHRQHQPPTRHHGHSHSHGHPLILNNSHHQQPPPPPPPPPQPQPWRTGKRSAEQVEAEENAYDTERIREKIRSGTAAVIAAAAALGVNPGSYTPPATATTTTTTTTTAPSTATGTPRGDSRSNSRPPTGGEEEGGRREGGGRKERAAAPILGADKNAALLLMNLSVGDARGARSRRAAATGAGGVTSEMSSPCDGTFPRIKRLRANSM